MKIIVVAVRAAMVLNAVLHREASMDHATTSTNHNRALVSQSGITEAKCEGVNMHKYRFNDKVGEYEVTNEYGKFVASFKEEVHAYVWTSLMNNQAHVVNDEPQRRKSEVTSDVLCERQVKR